MTGIAKEHDGYVLTTSRGTVQAKEAMLGTNGYTGQATPWHARRLIPLGSYIIATEPLPTERINSMFRNFCTMSNTQRILYYYRPSPDYTRVIFGGRASFTDTDETRSSKTLYEYLCGVFPQLRGVKSPTGGAAMSPLRLIYCRTWAPTTACITAWGATAAACR